MALQRVDPTEPRGLAYRAWVWVAGLSAVGWVSRHVGWKIDPWLMRVSKGRVGFGLLLPTALLETTGARSGTARANVVLYFHDGADVIIAASHLGLGHHPSWFHNAVAHPDVVLGGEPFHATVVDPADAAEVARLWSLGDRIFPTFARYRAQAEVAGRTIPVLRLTPR